MHRRSATYRAAPGATATAAPDYALFLALGLIGLLAGGLFLARS